MDEEGVTWSANATARWKRVKINKERTKFNLANHRRLTSIVREHNAPMFLNIGNQIDNTQKVTKLEDLKEISSQLGMLRNKHDRARAVNLVSEYKRDILQSEMNRINKTETRTGAKLDYLKDQATDKEEELRLLLKKKDDAEHTTDVYENMIERMQKEKIDLDWRTNKLEKEIRNMSLTLKEELEKQRRKREDKIHTKKALDYLKDYIDREKVDTKLNVRAIENDLRQKKANSLRREERQRRQLEIAETAANDDKDRSAMDKREGLLILRLWHAFLNAKMKDQMNRSASIEEAFQKVRIVGELSDTEEMVQKVMTKEQEYNDLVKSVIVSKGKVDSFIDKNETIEKRIKQLNMSKHENTSDIEEIEEKVSKERFEIAVKKDRLERIATVVQNVSIWMNKIISQINKNSDNKIEFSDKFTITEMSAILNDYIKNNVKNFSQSEKKVPKVEEIISELPVEVKQKLMRASPTERDLDEEELIRGLGMTHETQ